MRTTLLSILGGVSVVSVWKGFLLPDFQYILLGLLGLMICERLDDELDDRQLDT